MGASTFFMSGATMMVLFNFFYLLFYPEEASMLVLGTFTGLIVQASVMGVVGGIRFLGTGLSDASIKIIFGIATLLNAMFQIQILSVPLGVGLANNIVNAFASTELLGLGYFVASSLTILTLLSGIMMLIGGSE